MNVGKGLSWPLGTPPEFVAYWEDIRRQLYATQEQVEKLANDKATLADIWTQQQIRDADEIADLTRERDEARAERDAARVVGASLAPTEAGVWKDAWEEMRHIAGKLEAERDRLRALLREVEWQEHPPDWFSGAECLFCREDQENGHAPDCRLAAALEGRDDSL